MTGHCDAKWHIFYRRPLTRGIFRLCGMYLKEKKCLLNGGIFGSIFWGLKG